MSILHNYTKLSRKSKTYAILINLPYLSYLFLLLQMRGGYVMIQQFYAHYKYLPSFLETIILSMRYTIVASISCLIINTLFLYLGFNYFAQVIVYFIQYIGQYFETLIEIPMASYIFADLTYLLTSKEITYTILKINFITFFSTFSLLSFIGSLLAISNITNDNKRNQPKLEV